MKKAESRRRRHKANDKLHLKASQQNKDFLLGKTRFADPHEEEEREGVVLNNFPFATDKCRTLNLKWKFKWATPPISPRHSLGFTPSLRTANDNAENAMWQSYHLSIWGSFVGGGALSRIRWLTWRFATFFYAKQQPLSLPWQKLSKYLVLMP